MNPAPRDTRPESRRRALIAALLAAHCACVAAAEETKPPRTPREAQGKLSEIRGQIEALSGRLGEARSTRDRLQAELRETESKAGLVTRQLREIERRLAGKRAQLAALDKERSEQLGVLDGQRDALARQVRAAYAMGRQDYIKVLLNQQDPGALSRALTYYRYFHQARARRIDAIRAQLEGLSALEQTIQVESAALEQLRARQLSARDALDRFKAARAEVLTRIESEIQADGTALEDLQRDEQRLAGVLERLREELVDIARIADVPKPFATLLGKLALPAPGRLRHRFGTPRKSTKLTWQGVLIGASEGAPVRAVSHGRVAFADWLRGFGLLLIIDHGDGYMSLYGHNESLYKETGDWVESGEVVATVGATGGNAEPGLYFEIRHNGAPLDPLSWCTRPAQKTALATP